MKILVLNGPNLNMLGIREPHIYGKETYQQLCQTILNYCKEKQIEVDIYQSNHEGDLIDKIQQAYFQHFQGIIINPGAYTHTSIALLDVLKAVNLPTIEVHLSNIQQREDFRKISYVSLASLQTISGEGINGYIHAIDVLLKRTKI